MSQRSKSAGLVKQAPLLLFSFLFVLFLSSSVSGLVIGNNTVRGVIIQQPSTSSTSSSGSGGNVSGSGIRNQVAIFLNGSTVQGYSSFTHNSTVGRTDITCVFDGNGTCFEIKSDGAIPIFRVRESGTTDVNGQLLPMFDGVFDLGDENLKWRFGYFSQRLSADSFSGNGSAITDVCHSNGTGCLPASTAVYNGSYIPYRGANQTVNLARQNITNVTRIDARQVDINTSTDVVPLTVRASTSQTANIQEWHTVSGAVGGVVLPDGSFYLPVGSAINPSLGWPSSVGDPSIGLYNGFYADNVNDKVIGVIVSGEVWSWNANGLAMENGKTLTLKDNSGNVAKVSAKGTGNFGFGGVNENIDQTIGAQGNAGGNNVAGNNFTIQSGSGTGNSQSKAYINFQTPVPTVSGSTAQTYQTRMMIDVNGSVIPLTNRTGRLGHATLRWGEVWSRNVTTEIVVFSPQDQQTCGAALEGAVYYNTTTKKHYGCNSTAWNALY